jgi:hypothetical protein
MLFPQDDDGYDTGREVATDEVAEQRELLSVRLKQAEHAIKVHSHELEKAQIVATSCRAGLEAVSNHAQKPAVG